MDSNQHGAGRRKAFMLQIQNDNRPLPRLRQTFVGATVSPASHALRVGRTSQRTASAASLVLSLLAVLGLGLGFGADVVSAQTFSLPSSIEVHAADSVTEEPAPYSKARIGELWREVLGTTGRAAIARKEVFVGRGGRAFVVASVPEYLSGSRQELDVYLREGGIWRLRGRMQYEPGGKRMVSKTFILPDLPEGPVLAEIHASGAGEGDWQAIRTESVRVPKRARLRLGFALDGVDPDKLSPVEVLLEAERVNPDDNGLTLGKPVEVLRRRIKPVSANPFWREESVDLSEFGGRHIRFRLSSRPAEPTAGPAPGVVWGAAKILYEEVREAFPAVVLISLDSLRADALGMYGALDDPSPNIDAAFGRNGAAFMGAVTQSVTTQAAHMTLLTSLNPCVHGSITPQAAAEGMPTLPSLFRQAGYRTVAFTDGGALAGPLGFDRGFDFYESAGGWDGPPGSSELNSIERATAWLRDHSGEPAFLFIHSYRTRPFRFAVGVDGRDIGMKRYRDEVRSADAAIGLLLEQLDRVSIKDRTLVVLTSGHGEEFFEHGAAGHGTHLYEESVRVPLLMRGAGVKPARRYRGQVGLIDVAPTMLELMKLSGSTGMQGKSLAAMLGGGNAPVMPRRFTEAHRTRRLRLDGTLQRWPPPAYSLRDGQRKLIMHAGAGALADFEAYDLATDPKEQHNLFDAELTPPWAGELKRVLQNYPAVCERLARPVGKAPKISLEDRAKLAVLGYAP